MIRPLTQTEFNEIELEVKSIKKELRRDRHLWPENHPYQKTIKNHWQRILKIEKELERRKI